MEIAKKLSRFTLWMSVFSIVIGLGLYCFRALQYASMESATALVIGIKERTSSDGQILYMPIFQFFVDQQEFRVTSSLASNPPIAIVNESVSVLYFNEDPSDALLDKFWSKWLEVVVLTSVGSVLFFCSFVLLLLGYFYGKAHEEMGLI
ncbi:MAG: DUF3592 domain-containing protein [Verrucomicrobiota bacterium]